MAGTSGGLALWTLANLLSLPIAARTLSVGEFGRFADYYLLISVLLVPAVALRVGAAEAAASRRSLPRAAGVGVVFAVATIACLVSWALRFADDAAAPLNTWLVVAATLASGVAWLGRGALQATGRYSCYSRGLVAESVSLVGLLAAAGLVGGSVSACLGAVALSRAIGCYGIDLSAIGPGSPTDSQRPSLRWKERPESMVAVDPSSASQAGLARRAQHEPPGAWLLRSYLPAALGAALFLALCSADVYLVGARFPDMVGDYLALFLPAKLPLIAGLIAAEAYVGVRTRLGRPALGGLMTASAVATFPFLAACLLVPNAVAGLLAGSGQLAFARLLPFYGLFSFASVLVYSLYLEGVLSARGRRVCVGLGLALAVEMAVLALVVGSVESLSLALPWLGVVSVGLVAVPVFLPGAWPRRAAGSVGGTPRDRAEPSAESLTTPADQEPGQ